MFFVKTFIAFFKNLPFENLEREVVAINVTKSKISVATLSVSFTIIGLFSYAQDQKRYNDQENTGFWGPFKSHP